MHVRKIRLALNCLPDCPVERRTLLDHYFDDILASVESLPDGWEISLNWPSTADYYVDPALTQGLEWWSHGTTVGEIIKQVSSTTRGQLSLNDSWTLYAWSKWLVKCSESGSVPDEVVVLHVDDHTDLMTPRLSVSPNVWNDSITGKVFDLFKPSTVRSAILSGAIGVGSFMAPFLHHVPRVKLRHLSQTAPVGSASDYSISPQTLADTILNAGSYRPSVTVDEHPKDLHSSIYRFTRNIEDWLADLPEAPILLHIDMDYFNNRFDGDSDWATSEKRHDPNLVDIQNAIDQLFVAIEATNVASRIEDVTVALSPRFFPSEFWPASIARLNQRLSPLGWEVETPKGSATSNGSKIDLK